jgi:hypothetical protein
MNNSFFYHLTTTLPPPLVAFSSQVCSMHSMNPSDSQLLGETPQQRVSSALAHCSICFEDARSYTTCILRDVGHLLRDAHVLEIGCGYFGGHSALCRELGAASFTGVDINKSAIESARAYEPHSLFIWDDPRYVLAKLERQHLVISWAVLDGNILDRAYAASLIDGIATHSRSGNHTIHWGGDTHTLYGDTFLRSGFERIVLPEYPAQQHLCAYRKR